MPEPLRITDLAEPELSEVQRMAIAYGESQAIDLSVDAVLAAAVERTGLDDFGPCDPDSSGTDWRGRLARWLDETGSDPERLAIAHYSLFNDCVRYASNRLLVHDLLRRRPEIHDIEIVAPIIVIGLPRSGTTHLVNLLAADDRLRSMPLWESYEPVPMPGEGAGRDGVDPRYQRCARAWESMQMVSPHVAAMHPMNPDHIHEELELMLSEFTSYNLEWVARVPRWRDHYLATDQSDAYSHLRTMLKVLTYFRPRTRWVLKSPQHLEQIGPLMHTFPDATIVVTHRDPVSVVQSAATMVTYAARMGYRTPRPEFYVEYWTDRIVRLLDASVRDRALLPADRTLDVFFHQFMADDLATVDRVCDLAGWTLDDRARAQIAAHLDSHPRGKAGQVAYDLRADFGVTPDAVRSRFAFYFDRFPDVRLEVQ